MTPATASEPYCADAPSASTSTRSTAMAGITERSGPCAPSDAFGTSQAITAPRWRRLPLTMTRVWSAARLRMFGGRTTVAPSAMGCMFTLKDGTVSRSTSSMSVVPCSRSRSPPMTVTGDFDSIALRPGRRVPTTTTSSMASTCTPVSVPSAWSGRAGCTGARSRPAPSTPTHPLGGRGTSCPLPTAQPGCSAWRRSDRLVTRPPGRAPNRSPTRTLSIAIAPPLWHGRNTVAEPGVISSIAARPCSDRLGKSRRLRPRTRSPSCR